MGFPIKGCLGMSLPIAGLFIGWLGVVVSVICSVVSLNFLTDSRMYSPYAKERYDEDYGENITSFDSDEIYESEAAKLYFMIVGFFVTIVIVGVACLCLIIGIKKKSHIMIKPWLAVAPIAFFLSVLMHFFIKTIPWVLILVPVMVLQIAIGCWMWIVVYSLYKDIHQRNIKPTIPTSDTESNTPEDVGTEIIFK